MALPQESVSMALFCDFENVALGVRDAQYEKFDIKPVLERLLLKGSIVVKKAYCDWDRYKGFKAAMHEANFELIEIPHVRQSGKNSADIRLVVDALDLCYTKSHVDTFVIISGDSDFSPLVSKLRENAKQVIGVGIKQSTSDLLIANCDEFIFYDDLVRESQRSNARRESRGPQQATKRSPEEETRRKDEMEARRSKAIDLAVSTFDALVSERGDSGKMWASVLKEAIKRRRPDFNESYYGFRAFGNLLEAAQERGLLEFGRDEKSGTYVYRSNVSAEDHEHLVDHPVRAPVLVAAPESPASAGAAEAQVATSESRRRGRGGRKLAGKKAAAPVAVSDTQAQAAEKHVVAPSETTVAKPLPAVEQVAAPVPVVATVPVAPVTPAENVAPAPARAVASVPTTRKERSPTRGSRRAAREEQPVRPEPATAAVPTPTVAPAPTPAPTMPAATAAPAPAVVAQAAPAPAKKAARKRASKSASKSAARTRSAAKPEGEAPGE